PPAGASRARRTAPPPGRAGGRSSPPPPPPPARPSGRPPRLPSGTTHRPGASRPGAPPSRGPHPRETGGGPRPPGGPPPTPPRWVTPRRHAPRRVLPAGGGEGLVRPRQQRPPALLGLVLGAAPPVIDADDGRLGGVVGDEAGGQPQPRAQLHHQVGPR